MRYSSSSSFYSSSSLECGSAQAAHQIFWSFPLLFGAPVYNIRRGAPVQASRWAHFGNSSGERGGESGERCDRRPCMTWEVSDWGKSLSNSRSLLSGRRLHRIGVLRLENCLSYPPEIFFNTCKSTTTVDHQRNLVKSILIMVVDLFWLPLSLNSNRYNYQVLRARDSHNL